MKRIASIALVTLMTGTLFFTMGCDEKKSTGSEAEPVTSKRIYFYSTETDAYKVGSDWQEGNRYSYSFDDQGRLVAKEQAQWNSGVFQNTQKHAYEYDDRGRLVKETVSNGLSGSWEPYLRYEHSWNNDLLVSILGYQNQGGFWNEVWRRDLSYDFEGRLIGDAVNDYNGDCIDGLTRHAYTWDTNGRLAGKASYYTPFGGTEAGTWAWQYTYDLLGQLHEEIESYASGSSWVPATRFVHTYDAAGAPLSRTTYHYSSGAWVPSGRTRYVCNEYGQCIEEITEDRSGANWVATGMLGHVWDVNGALQETVSYGWSGTAWVASYRWTREILSIPSGAHFPEDQLRGPRPNNLNYWRLYGEDVNYWAIR